MCTSELKDKMRKLNQIVNESVDGWGDIPQEEIIRRRRMKVLYHHELNRYKQIYEAYKAVFIDENDAKTDTKSAENNDNRIVKLPSGKSVNLGPSNIQS